MTPEMVVDIGKRALEMTLLLGAPMLLFSLVVGVGISIVQATTQINEITLTFVPKIFAVFLALALFMPWMLRMLVAYVTELFAMIPGMVG
ncbi:MAG: flagellar biosynthesis protein FliQ [Nitrospirae bacterium]|nr:flagellar biosynthesis protein FliQ [Nitrospirota bacterium]